MPARGHKQSAATKAKISASLRRHYAARGVGFKSGRRGTDRARVQPAAGQLGGHGTVRIRAYGKVSKPVLTRGRSTGFLTQSGHVVRVGRGYNFKGK
jgi:hypothetical protein